jgi:hypothetical protein
MSGDLIISEISNVITKKRLVITLDQFVSLKRNVCLSIAITLFLVNGLFGQEQEAHHDDFERHQISLMTGYAWVPQAVVVEHTAETVIIPSIGIDYGYWFSHKFSLTLVNDLELSNYLVEDATGFLKREFKYVGAIVAFYEPVKGLGVFAGPGFEYDKHEIFSLLKVGIELMKHFEDGWGGGITTSVDINELYQTYTAGVAFSKKF